MILPASIQDTSGTGLEVAWELEGNSPHPIDGLSEASIRENARWVGLPEEAVEDCVEAAARVSADGHLDRLAAGAHHLLFHQTDIDPGVYAWPGVIRSLGDLTGPFYLLLGLSGIPSARIFLEGRGFTEDESRHCCRDLAIWANVHKTRGVPVDGGYRHPAPTTRWGLGPRNLGWCYRVLLGKTIRIGRLQYIHRPFSRPFRVYNHRSGGVTLLAESETSFTDEGRILTNGQPAWTAHLEEEPGCVAGSPVVDGYAVRQTLRLNLAEWTEVLRPGDLILEIHIPEDGPMGFSGCAESLLEARDRFGALFPDRPFKAFGCFSWLLDPQFQQILPATSNIVRFQRACHLLPLNNGNGRAGLSRIFHTEDLASAPRETSMQRAVLNHIASGGALYGGGAIILPQDLPWK